MIDGKRNKKGYLFAFLTFHTQSTDSLRSYLLFFFKIANGKFYNIKYINIYLSCKWIYRYGFTTCKCLKQQVLLLCGLPRTSLASSKASEVVGGIWSPEEASCSLVNFKWRPKLNQWSLAVKRCEVRVCCWLTHLAFVTYIHSMVQT